MMTLRVFAVSVLMLVSVDAAEFRSGQAARAVLGQASFTARDAGFTPTVLSLSGNNLYVADRNTRLLTFRVTQLPDRKGEFWRGQASACAACGFVPTAAVPQAVMPGLASVASYGKTLIAVDAEKRRVLVWRDTNASGAGTGPDFYLSGSEQGSAIGPSSLVQPISVAYDGRRLFIGDAALRRVLVWNTLPSSPDRSPDAVLGQRDFSSTRDKDEIGPDTIDTPAALASDGANLYVADSTAHRILVFTVSDEALRGEAVVNAASLKPGPVAPGTLINIENGNFAAHTQNAPDDSNEPLPTKLAGVKVFFNGIALPLLSVSETQVRAQVPYELGDATAASLYVRSERADGTVSATNAIAVPLVAVSPGLFAFPGKDPRVAMGLHRAHDGEGTGTPITTEEETKPGEIVTLWAAGLGQVVSESGAQPAAGTPYRGPDAPLLNPVTATTIGGISASVVSANLTSGALGIYEVRLLVPPDLPPDSKTPVSISQGESTSNTVTIPVRNTIQ